MTIVRHDRQYLIFVPDRINQVRHVGRATAIERTVKNVVANYARARSSCTYRRSARISSSLWILTGLLVT